MGHRFQLFTLRADWSLLCGGTVSTSPPQASEGFKRYLGEVKSVAFSPDGQKLVAISENVSIRAASALQWHILEGNYPEWVGSFTASVKCRQGAVDVVDRWITVNQKRMIWPPPARTTWMLGTKLAIGSPTGIVTILNSDLKLTLCFFCTPLSWLYTCSARIFAYCHR